MEGFVLHALWTELKHHRSANWNPSHICFILVYANTEYHQKSKQFFWGRIFAYYVFIWKKNIEDFVIIWTMLHIMTFYLLMGAWKSFKINVRLFSLKYTLNLQYLSILWIYSNSFTVLLRATSYTWAVCKHVWFKLWRQGELPELIKYSRNHSANFYRQSRAFIPLVLSVILTWSLGGRKNIKSIC